MQTICIMISGILIFQNVHGIKFQLLAIYLHQEKVVQLLLLMIQSTFSVEKV